MQEKVPTSMHSVTLEPTEFILTGTRATYQATGDAGYKIVIFFIIFVSGFPLLLLP